MLQTFECIFSIKWSVKWLKNKIRYESNKKYRNNKFTEISIYR
jgi:hypothetical protein